MGARFTESDVLLATGATKTRGDASIQFECVTTDTRQLTPGCLFVALRGERFDGHDFLNQALQGGASGVVVDAGRAPSMGNASVYEVSNTLEALGRLARWHRDRFRFPIVGVTGSNGKTTTKELVASILATRGPAHKTYGNLNNEIGVPLTLFGLESSHVAAVIEMGMNHPGEISRMAHMTRPDAGLITVVQAAHLEGLGSIEAIADAKGELFRALDASSIAVVNVDDARVEAQSRGIEAKRVTYGSRAGVDVQWVSTEPLGRNGQSLNLMCAGVQHRVRLQLMGTHNAMNAVGAFALAWAVGYTPQECVQGLETAPAPARRIQVLDGARGVTVIDDCYNANPSSMAAALAVLRELSPQGRAFAVLGDMLELGESEMEAHHVLLELALSQTSVLALFGPRMKRALSGRSEPERVQQFDDISPLVAWLQGQLQPGDVVLVKGSRGMRLERVVEALTGQVSPVGGH
jgi:UDP-N-acetylmuramoyl-tripeptide--D-alanyl-D-alanine ligase